MLKRTAQIKVDALRKLVQVLLNYQFFEAICPELYAKSLLAYPDG